MKKIILTSLAVLATAGANAAAAPYASLKAGYISDSEENGSAGGFTGAIAGGAAFSIAPQFDIRAEVEYAYGRTSKDENNATTTLSTNKIMAKGYADWKATNEIKPYAGFGLGYAVSSMSFGEMGVDLEGAFVWGVGAGVAYQLNDKLAIDLGGKYEAFSTKPSDQQDGTDTINFSSWSVLLGARYAF